MKNLFYRILGNPIHNGVVTGIVLGVQLGVILDPKSSPLLIFDTAFDAVVWLSLMLYGLLWARKKLDESNTP